MPPRTAPYATRGARAVDPLLVALALIAILLGIWTAPRYHSKSRDAATIFNAFSVPGFIVP